MKLIDPNIVSYEGQVRDEELKRRLLTEAYEQANFLGPDGKPLKGVTGSVIRFGGRAGHGGYSVKVSRDLRQSDQQRLTAPEGGK